MIGKSQIRFPPSNEPRAIAPALCQNRSQDDPKPPFHRLRLHSSSKECIIHWAPPSNNLLYALMQLRFCYDFFFSFCFSLFWKKNCAHFSSPSYATEFVYLPVVKYNVYPSTHTYQKGIEWWFIFEFYYKFSGEHPGPISVTDCFRRCYKLFLQYSITCLSYENARHRWHFVFAALIC